MHTHPNLTEPFFGRPCVRNAHPLEYTPNVGGWSLGGLSPIDRVRLAAFVMGDARRGDTDKAHGPERPVILPFIASIEVRYNGAWVPEANGSSVWWLQRELDSIVQCYRRVRVVSPWGEELDLNGRQA